MLNEERLGLGDGHLTENRVDGFLHHFVDERNGVHLRCFDAASLEAEGELSVGARASDNP